MSKISQEAQKFNLPEEKLLGDWIVCIPGFTLEKYRRLQESRLSILTMNCFGGIISNTLGLPFLSPFVNMFLNEPDYLRFLKAPRALLEQNLIFKEAKWESNLKFNYPVVKLGDVEMHMNHYRSFEEAVAKWNERKARINWDNLFVMAYTESKDFLEQFDAFPYDKKVCFVPFKSELNSAWHIERKNKPRWAFWKVITEFAKGNPFYYEPFDMLLYGKKTPL